MSKAGLYSTRASVAGSLDTRGAVMTTRKTFISEHADCPEHMLEENKRLVFMGASLIPIRFRDKSPVEPGWQNRKSYTWAELKKKFERRHNIGFKLGEASVIDGKYPHIIDMDIHVDEDAPEAWAALGELFPGYDFSKFPRVISGSGGESRHIYFVTDRPFPTKTLARSKKTFKDAKGKTRYNWQIERCGTGRQVLLPPSVHPSGGRYVWENEIDLDGCIPEIASKDVEQGINGVEHPMARANGHDIDLDRPKADLTDEEIEETVMSLPEEWLEDYHYWIKVGMALHDHYDGSDVGLAIWRRFSKQSKKFEEHKMRQFWRRFQTERDEKVRIGTLVMAARAVTPDDFDDIPDYSLRDEFEDLPPRGMEDWEYTQLGNDKIPSHLLRIPGALQHFVDFCNDTAQKPQPQLAVQAGLAFGSVVLSRNHTTDEDNYTSLYFVNIADTGEGKEHVRKTINKCLRFAGLSKLIGGSGYTSHGGVVSKLSVAPRHMIITDEFGRYLKAARDDKNANKSEAESILMELFGLLDGVYVGINYSAMGKTKDQANAALHTEIERPAVTLVALTTGEVFYSALAGADVGSGFLNRFLIVQSSLTDQLRRRGVKQKDVPEELIAWAKKYANNHGGDKDDDFEAKVDPTFAPPPARIPFTDEANEILQKFELEIREEKKRLRPYGMSAMLLRVEEITMRISLIVALSCGAKRILAEHVQWARDYVWFYQKKMIDVFRENIGKGPLEIVADKLEQMIRERGDDGMTRFEMGRYCRPFRSLNAREREEVIQRLEQFSPIKFGPVKKGGNARKAWIWIGR